MCCRILTGCILKPRSNAELASRRGWRLVFESGSMAGCMLAAQCGLAVTLLSRSQLHDGLREARRAERLPNLLTIAFYAFAREDTPASRALIEVCREVGRRDRFGSHAKSPHV
jgi:DNA-binding transcriptional LysR family regulator